ncbi:peroxisomal-coenzyme A synthetase [Sporothrix schenckii 1099-18]|uniref:Peroxisomal-coenzyme A synthetase n=1 Tax=Sporothrix schenckii 1099-18 TaxID=1397361 RepID=A0A0F2LUD4_SPOSC|nr:peroxisomal-coenzyme A synthetase [Sporothrix schenckii 1099-18]KJR81077.1 peroxisomal-coenzyme A synthetase [Sporothrix schenckii 1099-18]
MSLTLRSAINGASSSTAVIVPAAGPGAQPLEVSYLDLVSEVSRYQAKLAALGIGRRAPVSIATVNSYEFIVSFLAASWQRAVAAPLNPAYKQDEFEFYIEDVQSAIVLVPKGAFAADAPAVRAARKFRAAIAESYWDAERGEVALDVKEFGRLESGPQPTLWPKPHDVALVLHTRCVFWQTLPLDLLTFSGAYTDMGQRNNIETESAYGYSSLYLLSLTTQENIQDTYKLTPADRSMLVMPLFHVHGLLCGLLAPLFSGGSLIVPPKFSATEFWRDFVGHKANWYTAVPTIHQILLKHPIPNPRPSIRFVRSCSSPLSPTVFAQLEEALGAPVLEAYAMTEAAHQMTSNPLPPAKRKPGAVGLGQGVEVRILNDAGAELPQGQEGEICVKGDNVTSGYLNNPTANATAYTADGFFRTGDQGRKDEDGYIQITGRIKELINKAGEKISPIELDNVLTRHPEVADAVSFAIKDDVYGEDIGVAVVRKPGSSLQPEALQRWAAEKLAKFKVPKKVYFTDVMPKTATGKIQRRIVAETMQKQDSKAKL